MCPPFFAVTLDEESLLFVDVLVLGVHGSLFDSLCGVVERSGFSSFPELLIVVAPSCAVVVF